MHATTRSRVIVVTVAAVIAALVAFAVVHARGENLDVPTKSPHAVAALGHHARPCPPRNKHCHRPPPPNPGCTWVVGGAIGDVPRCVGLADRAES